jgi:protein TonB
MAHVVRREIALKATTGPAPAGGSAGVGAGSSSGFSWSFVASLGLHAALAGGVAWITLSAPPRKLARSASFDAGTAEAALALPPVLEPEPVLELVVETPIEPALVEVELPFQPLLPLEGPGAPPNPDSDSMRDVVKLLNRSWSTGAAELATTTGDGAESAGVGSGAVAAAPAPSKGEGSVYVAARHLATPEPAYPRLSQRLGEQGTVDLRLHIRADGTVADVTLLVSSGFERLDAAAMTAVRAWRFEAATSDGVPVESDLRHLVTFRIEGP